MSHECPTEVSKDNTIMASTEKRISQDGKESYRVKIRLKGHPVITETFHRKTDAKRWVQKTESLIREGRYFETNDGRKRTLNELIDKYITNRLPHRGDDKETVKPQLEWWKLQIGAYLLKNVTPQLIVQYRDKLLNEPQLKSGENQPRQLKNSTVIRYLASLSVCFSYAIEDLGWLKENPVKQVKKPKPERGRVRYLTEHEQNILITTCKSSNYRPLLAILLIAITTGARKSEILNLKWQDIDLQQKQAIFENTKNGERRSAPLSAPVIKNLNQLKKVPRIDTNYVFPGIDGTKPKDIRRHWNTAIKKANKLLKEQGLSSSLKDFRFHDLRHTAASYLAMEGASLLEIAEILGHKTMSMVKRYSHLTNEHTKKVVENMVDKRISKSL